LKKINLRKEQVQWRGTKTRNIVFPVLIMVEVKETITNIWPKYGKGEQKETSG